MARPTKKPDDVTLFDLLVKNDFNVSSLAKELGEPRRTVNDWVLKLDVRNDEEIIEHNIKLQRQKQKAQDLTRIERKSLREGGRVANAIQAYSEELKLVFKDHDLSKLTKKHKTTKSNSKAVGVIHLSDLHFNELVELEHNQYNFDIAGQRIKLLIDKATAHFSSQGIKNVFVAFTGDLMNSDRRLDEVLATPTNRAKATFLAVDILQQAILHLNAKFNVTVGWVNGNEGRVPKDVGLIDRVASDNYDEQILLTLAYLFKGAKGVEFLQPTNALELVADVAGQKLLLVHGHTLGRDLNKGLAKVRSKYASRGVVIDYVIFGHIHEAYISDMFARSGSPVGDNAYSDRGLNLCGRASQNYYIFYPDGSRDGVKVDLQHANGEGYSTEHSLHEDAYTKKSADKLSSGVVIHQVVI